MPSFYFQWRLASSSSSFYKKMTTFVIVIVIFPSFFCQFLVIKSHFIHINLQKDKLLSTFWTKWWLVTYNWCQINIYNHSDNWWPINHIKSSPTVIMTTGDRRRYWYKGAKWWWRWCPLSLNVDDGNRLRQNDDKYRHQIVIFI